MKMARTNLEWVISSIALLTPGVLLVHGYHPLADDGAVYATGIKKLANPGLYPSDAVFALSPTHLSVFAHLLAPLLRWMPLPDLLLVCQLASVFLFLLGSWRVANQLFSADRARWAAVLLAGCCFTLPIAGTSLSIMDPYVTARSFSMPLSLFALAAVLEESWAWSILWLALAALLHPLMAVYSAIAMLTVAGCQRRLWRSLCLFYGLGWGLCVAIFLATHHADSNIASVCPQNPGLKSETWATHSKSGGCSFISTKKPCPSSRLILFPMHQAALDGADCSLGPVSNAHLVQHAAHMDAHCLVGYPQLLGYVAVALAAGDTGKYFVLARSQLYQRGSFRQAVPRDRRKITHALVHSNDGFHQLFSTCVLV
jgi:hypothetical protein